MGRGKPFKTSLQRLVQAGVVPKPAWMDVVEATKPPFEPVSTTRTRALIYPEDRLRSTFLRRNREVRRIPVRLNAASISERHIADKFVTAQLSYMEQHNLTEEEAFHAAMRLLRIKSSPVLEGAQEGESWETSETDDNDSATLLYMASVRDSHRDKALHGALTRQHENNS